MPAIRSRLKVLGVRSLKGAGALLIIVALVFGANMIPSKRGHQD